MKAVIKNAEIFSKKLKNVSLEEKEKMLIVKFGYILPDETCKSIAKTF